MRKKIKLRSSTSNHETHYCILWKYSAEGDINLGKVTWELAGNSQANLDQYWQTGEAMSKETESLMYLNSQSYPPLHILLIIKPALIYEGVALFLFSLLYLPHLDEILLCHWSSKKKSLSAWQVSKKTEFYTFCERCFTSQLHDTKWIAKLSYLYGERFI